MNQDDYFNYPDELWKFVLSRATREDVNSVSCQFPDCELWEGLLAEQIRRAKLSGKPPREAFCLCGPDHGLPGIAERHADSDDEPIQPTGDTLEEKMGGDIHIPYEGVSGGDFFVFPSWWRKIHPEAWEKKGAELDWATPMTRCNHLLINLDLGEPACATRISPVPGWWLYSSTAPYKDCNPFRCSPFHAGLY